MRKDNFIQLSRVKLIICQVVKKTRSSANVLHDVIVFVIKMHQETVPLEILTEIKPINNNNQ